MCGVTRTDKIRNEHIRGTTSSAGVQKYNGEKTEMVWARHEDGRRPRSSDESDYENDTGERKTGRPKTRWKGVCKRDMQTVGLREGDEGDRAYWKETINNHSRELSWREQPAEKKKKRVIAGLMIVSKTFFRFQVHLTIAHFSGHFLPLHPPSYYYIVVISFRTPSLMNSDPKYLLGVSAGSLASTIFTAVSVQ